MSIINDLLYESPYGLSEGLQALRDQVDYRCKDEAERLILTLPDALEAIALYPEHVPDPADVADRLGRDLIGDYQAVTLLTGMLTVEGHLVSQVESDIRTIEKALHEATLTGFVARKLYYSCPHDWMPHDRETDLNHGTLFEWTSRGGAFDAAMIRLSLSDGGTAWINLAWVD